MVNYYMQMQGHFVFESKIELDMPPTSKITERPTPIPALKGRGRITRRRAFALLLLEFLPVHFHINLLRKYYVPKTESTEQISLTT